MHRAVSVNPENGGCSEVKYEYGQNAQNVNGWIKDYGKCVCRKFHIYNKIQKIIQKKIKI